MLLEISHTTTYHYDEPVPYGLQELRLRPQSRSGQTVLHWATELRGATREVVFDDQFANAVELVSLGAEVTEVTVTAVGAVETTDTAGVVPRHRGYAPLWLFERPTELTAPGAHVAALVGEIDDEPDDIARFHQLSERILERVAYEAGTSVVTSTAEDVLAAGRGVCQDHAHVFVAAARALGFPARYVSGYLMTETGSDATHAWAQVWIEGLGWLGFDVANEICPDDRYVEVATGLDYRGAAPISGVRFGDASERISVSVQVQQ